MLRHRLRLSRASAARVSQSAGCQHTAVRAHKGPWLPFVVSRTRHQAAHGAHGTPTHKVWPLATLVALTSSLFSPESAAWAAADSASIIDTTSLVVVLSVVTACAGWFVLSDPQAPTPRKVQRSRPGPTQSQEPLLETVRPATQQLPAPHAPQDFSTRQAPSATTLNAASHAEASQQGPVGSVPVTGPLHAHTFEDPENAACSSVWEDSAWSTLSMAYMEVNNTWDSQDNLDLPQHPAQPESSQDLLHPAPSSPSVVAGLTEPVVTAPHGECQPAGPTRDSPPDSSSDPSSDIGPDVSVWRWDLRWTGAIDDTPPTSPYGFPVPKEITKLRPGYIFSAQVLRSALFHAGEDNQNVATWYEAHKDELAASAQLLKGPPPATSSPAAQTLGDSTFAVPTLVLSQYDGGEGVRLSDEGDLRSLAPLDQESDFPAILPGSIFSPLVLQSALHHAGVVDDSFSENLHLSLSRGPMPSVQAFIPPPPSLTDIAHTLGSMATQAQRLMGFGGGSAGAAAVQQRHEGASSGLSGAQHVAGGGGGDGGRRAGGGGLDAWQGLHGGPEALSTGSSPDDLGSPGRDRSAAPSPSPQPPLGAATVTAETLQRLETALSLTPATEPTISDPYYATPAALHQSPQDPQPGIPAPTTTTLGAAEEATPTATRPAAEILYAPDASPLALWASHHPTASSGAVDTATNRSLGYQLPHAVVQSDAWKVNGVSAASSTHLDYSSEQSPLNLWCWALDTQSGPAAGAAAVVAATPAVPPATEPAPALVGSTKISGRRKSVPTAAGTQPAAQTSSASVAEGVPAAAAAPRAVTPSQKRSSAGRRSAKTVTAAAATSSLPSAQPAVSVTAAIMEASQAEAKQAAGPVVATPVVRLRRAVVKRTVSPPVTGAEPSSSVMGVAAAGATESPPVPAKRGRKPSKGVSMSPPGEAVVATAEGAAVQPQAADALTVATPPRRKRVTGPRAASAAEEPAVTGAEVTEQGAGAGVPPAAVPKRRPRQKRSTAA